MIVLTFHLLSNGNETEKKYLTSIHNVYNLMYNVQLVELAK